MKMLKTSRSIALATPAKPRRRFYRLEGQKNEFSFSCGNKPGINLLKAFDGDTRSLDGREEPMFDNYGKKVTYIVQLKAAEFTQQKYAQKAARTIRKEEAVKQIAQVVLEALQDEYTKGDEEPRSALKGLELISLTRVGKSSFVCTVKREADAPSHVPIVNKPWRQYDSPSDPPSGVAVPYSNHLTASDTAGEAPLLHSLPYSEDAMVYGASTFTQTWDVVEAYASDKLQQITAYENTCTNNATSNGAPDFGVLLLATRCPSPGMSIAPTLCTPPQLCGTASMFETTPLQRYSDPVRDDGADVASRNAGISDSSTISSPTNTVSDFLGAIQPSTNEFRSNPTGHTPLERVAADWRMLRLGNPMR